MRFLVRSFVLILILFAANLSAQKFPKNIIILIGDGMGVTQVSTSVLSMKNDAFKKFTSVGLSITCSADKLITDSAAGATAIATGYRTNYYWISVDPETNKPLKTLLEHAEELNKSTGVVVTSSVTHATPAAFLSHVDSRKYENEIAAQILERDVDVVIGGGSKFFTPLSSGGAREDNKDLTDVIKSKGFNYYTDYQELKNSDKKDKFFALLSKEGLPRAAERNYTLGELTDAAIEKLRQNDDGFILMVEGSQIDWTAHDHLSELFLKEMEDFNTAINTALDFAEEDGKTLVLVTADHETGGMSINGGELDGSNLVLKYTSSGHTPALVGVFAKGPGEENFSGVYDNYMIGRKLFKLLDSTYSF